MLGRLPNERGKLARAFWKLSSQLAPLQKAGLLAGEVLNKKDIDKAIADRACWRSDERRWVRAGKLPRCGWMDESVPESPAWTELVPARKAERRRLEE